MYISYIHIWHISSYIHILWIWGSWGTSARQRSPWPACRGLPWPHRPLASLKLRPALWRAGGRLNLRFDRKILVISFDNMEIQPNLGFHQELRSWKLGFQKEVGIFTRDMNNSTHLMLVIIWWIFFNSTHLMLVIIWWIFFSQWVVLLWPHVLREGY